jgi:hypothetical protein
VETRTVEAMVRHISAIADDGHPSLFMISLPYKVSMEARERLTQYWDQAWRSTGRLPVKVIVLDGDIKVTALTPTALRDIGLMRIDPPAPDAVG